MADSSLVVSEAGGDGSLWEPVLSLRRLRGRLCFVSLAELDSAGKGRGLSFKSVMDESQLATAASVAYILFLTLGKPRHKLAVADCVVSSLLKRLSM
jgi:hypothetical protein